MTSELIAVAGRDGETITGHFGRAHVFVVVSTVDGIETGREIRRVAGEHHHDHRHAGGGHHAGLLALVADCDTVVGGGIGRPMAQQIEALDKRLVLTSERSIDAALAALLAGTLAHEPDLAHEPRH